MREGDVEKRTSRRMIEGEEERDRHTALPMETGPHLYQRPRGGCENKYTRNLIMIFGKHLGDYF